MSLTLEELTQVVNRAELLVTAEQVSSAIVRMAQQITEDLADKQPVVLVVMNGGVIPAGQLLPKLAFPLTQDYVHASRYRGETVGKDLHWINEPTCNLGDRTVLIIDDILDEGHTLKGIQDYCLGEGAANVKSAVLVEKLHNRKAENVTADYIGVQVEDKYVFGMGMDYKGYLRNYPGIYAVANT